MTLLPRKSYFDYVHDFISTEAINDLWNATTTTQVVYVFHHHFWE